MKRFIVYTLGVAIFFVGIGAMADGVAGKFKSDQKALEIIAKSRMAIGGDMALAQVRSMVIVGRSTHTLKTDGGERTELGEMEIALQFPDKLMKKVRIGEANGSASGERQVTKHSDVVIMRKSDGEVVNWEGKDGEFVTGDGKTVVVRRADGEGAAITDGRRFISKRGEGQEGEFTTEDGNRVIIRTVPGSARSEVSVTGGGSDDARVVSVGRGDAGRKIGGTHQNELLRTALMLLLKAPEGMDVAYTYEGEGNVDGTTVNIVAASFAGAVYRLHIDKYTDLPVAFGYTGRALPQVVRISRGGSGGDDGVERGFFIDRNESQQGGTSEFLIRLSDYRSTGGVQLPYRWTTTKDGQVSEIFDLTSYEVNPENITERFSRGDNKVLLQRVPGN